MIFTPHVKIRDEKFGTVIFETLKEKVFVTNEIGRDIIELVKNGKTSSEMAAILSQRYEGPVSQIKDDVAAFVARLSEQGIIT